MNLGDQFGVAHAPFAMGRSFLTERGYGDCKVLIHQQRSSKRSVRADESNTDLRLVEVPASDLAPSPPDIFGKVVTKNHSHGLQIEF
ncbi:hypothetical protein HJC23_006740 [Cyclotella cryptica]|uniref:Uncharacterized protein n=1 Tax=Cyclotella cryptica TaxID=29204 RepID=A0ABD3PP72_9STRA